MQNYNIEEILKIAIKIEQNGRAFYLKAASLCPIHEKWLNRLADEEIAHEHVFEMFQNSLVKHDDQDPAYFDAENLAMAYLHSIADSIIFNLAKDPTDSFSDNPTINEIIEDALRREHEAILFYTGIKMALSEPKTAQEIELIIREEMGHVAWLKRKQIEISEEGIEKKPEPIYDVVVIGAGPGGISMGAELVSKGLDPEKMIILESAEKNSWIIRKLYPEQMMVTAKYKGSTGESHGVMKMRNLSKESTLQMLTEAVKDYGLKVAYGQTVVKIEKVDSLFHVETKTQVIKALHCVISIGVFGKPNHPDYEIPGDVVKKIFFDVTGSKIQHQHVLVVGGGDSASEYTKTLLENGNKITLSAREEDLSCMNEENRRLAMTQSLAGQLTLLAGSDIKAIEPEDGSIRVLFKDKEPTSLVVDSIVYALGGTTPMKFLKVAGLEMDGSQPVLKESCESTVKGLYLTGDLAAKTEFGSISSAFNTSFEAAKDLALKLNLKIKV